MAEFVNPYTFVPHAPVPERKVPAGHAIMDADRFSGVLKVTLTAKTPLLVGGFTPDGKEEKAVLPRRKDPAGAVMIPGSGLMGAVRSVHEALAGGCMRVLDLNRAPVHRHPANEKETELLRLAVVTRIGASGQAEEVRLCDRWYWVPAELLPGDGCGQPVRTGDQVQYERKPGETGDFPSKAVGGGRKRRLVRGYDAEKYPEGLTPGDIVRLRGMAPVSGDCKVVLVTSTNARGSEPVYFAVGDIGPDSPSMTVPESTWGLYLRTVDGADDLRPEVLAKKAGVKDGKRPVWTAGMTPEYADVWWPPRPEEENQGQEGERGDTQARLIGKRLYHREYFHVGQPVWVAVLGNKVTEIRLSQLWRYEGSFPVGERLGDPSGQAKGCTDWRDLCWSCRIFGSADTEGRGANELAEQNSYRGHVRIDDLLADRDVRPIEWDLAPLASPKPSAGQFYLDNKNRPGLAEQNTRPMATWGSEADKTDPRPIRGRKFYWRTDTKADPDASEPQRGKAREHQAGKALSKKVELIPAETVFTGRITFDNLSSEDYGSLLAALNPRCLGTVHERGWEQSVLSVGGGKPFGFGSVEIEVESVSVQGARERYLGESGNGQVPEPDEAVRAFLEAVPPDVKLNTWPALRHALEFGFVNDEDVWYPPGDGQRGDEGYDKSFEFFALTNGLRYSEGHGDRHLVRLPDAARGRAQQKITSPAGQAPRREPRGGRQR